MVLGASEPCRVLKTRTPVERGADADPGGLIVADLADHDDVGVLAEHRPQPFAEAHVARIVDLRLVDPGNAVLDRVFDRHHVLERRVDPLQAVVKRRGLAGADRPGDQDGPVGLGDQLVERLGLLGGHAQMGEALDVGQHLVNPDDDLLAEDRGKSRQPQVARLVVMLDRDPAVLRVLALDDVEIRDDLEPADDRRGHRRLDEQDVLELAVDSVADAQAAFLGIEMNVGGLAVARPLEDLVDQLRQAGGRGLLLQVLADIAMMLGAIGRERRAGQPAAAVAVGPGFAVVGGQGAQVARRPAG